MTDRRADAGFSDYLLGTHVEELERLGLQHRLWAEEAAAFAPMVDIIGVKR